MRVDVRICTMWVHLIFGSCAALLMIAIGIFFLVNANSIGDDLNKLPDDDLTSLLQAMSVSGTWTVDGLRVMLTEGFRAYGVMTVAISLVVIFTAVLGAILLQ